MKNAHPDAPHEIKTLEKLHNLRKRVIRLHLKGVPIMKIVSMTGLSWPGVRTALNLYEQGGMAALKPVARGRKPGSGRRLTDRQDDTIRLLISRYCPDDIWMKHTLWNRAAVIQLVERVTGITLSMRGVGNYLQRWGFVYCNPFDKMDEAGSDALSKWWHEEYPVLERRAQIEGAEINWGDEQRLASGKLTLHRLIQVGQARAVTAGVVGRRRLMMILTVNRQGYMRWMITDEALNSARLILFLDALIRDAHKKIFLILNNLPVHRSKTVRDWVAAHPDQIELFYLPSYSHPARNAARAALRPESATEYYGNTRVVVRMG